jgi:hypothetical protein
MPREAQRQSDRQAGPRGAGECGHHVDTLRHQPHEAAREAAMGTRVPTSQAIQKRSRARTEKEREGDKGWIEECGRSQSEARGHHTPATLSSSRAHLLPGA